MGKKDTKKDTGAKAETTTAKAPAAEVKTDAKKDAGKKKK